MGFGDLSKAKGIECLDSFLLTRSYIEGFQPSKADCVVFDSVSEVPDAKYTNALRWYNHIKSFGDQRQEFPGQAKKLDFYGPSCELVPAPKEDSEDDDLFASDNDEEAGKTLLKSIASNNAQKASDKPVPKSMIILDVKVWDDETDMALLEKCVRSIEADGLVWGASKLVPVCRGINKLQITCVVEDEKVGTDFLEESILKFEDVAQSVDIAAFNKL